MPLVDHSGLPTFQRLRAEGQDILRADYAEHQDIRELHIGLLNMMPDSALMATERQFFRLVGMSNQIAQFHMHVFTLDGLVRGEAAQAHIAQYYENFADLKKQGLDALIISGANPAHPKLEDEPFWEGLMEVVEWAKDHVTSTLCSCLASHAIVQHLYGIRRRPLGFKRWGVYGHALTMPEHPLVSNLNTHFDVPHSRFNEVSREQLEEKGLRVLAESAEASFHLAVSPDLFRFVFFQGHPEYDAISLLKEFRREVNNWYVGKRSDYPPFPQNCFRPQVKAILNEYRLRLEAARQQGTAIPAFPDASLISLLPNTWRDTAKGMVSNWIGKVYQLTNNERHLPFMEGIDPNDPLGLR
ncbi:homoserine O-succinyltransferase [uncultured Thiothrix sp.]|uniref:homoserine O-succinyltransferase MetA n=1 Tax=uncultured Thiothrix sp. TaxID=223185 RepID=UPI0026158933|nr:homoserine O-succinyltransferase [uncultured Thiothrix sp.]HMT94795.1 homoserine O-succinyltransferase [Thiolinea sp.]